MIEKRLFPYLMLLSLTLAAQPLLFAQSEEAQNGGRWQARSMVETKFGIVATSQTLASAAGAHILEMGGNAIDAAIAANAVLGVVEPCRTASAAISSPSSMKPRPASSMASIPAAGPPPV